MSLEVIILRLEAPMMSFGGPTVDGLGVTEEFPPPSMIAGLLGNALGYRREQHEALQALQDALVIGVRDDSEGHRQCMRDYQNVQRDTPWMDPDFNGWSTLGPFTPKNTKGDIVQRWRDYWVNARYTVLVALREDVSGAPTLEDLSHALQRPARPLYLGRACCIPTAPLWGGRQKGPSMISLLQRIPLTTNPGGSVRCPAWWPEQEVASDVPSKLIYISAGRDWRSQIHVGRMAVNHGFVEVGEEPS